MDGDFDNQFWSLYKNHNRNNRTEGPGTVQPRKNSVHEIQDISYLGGGKVGNNLANGKKSKIRCPQHNQNKLQIF